MEIKIDVKDESGVIQQHIVKTSYLSKFVDPNKEYPVSYTIDSDGKRVNNPAFLKGEDLTENQIAQLFAKGLL